MVETAIIREVVLVSLSVAELGETLQAEREGAPVQLKDTVWLKPPPDEAETE